MVPSLCSEPAFHVEFHVEPGQQPNPGVLSFFPSGDILATIEVKSTKSYTDLANTGHFHHCQNLARTLKRMPPSIEGHKQGSMALSSARKEFRFPRAGWSFYIVSHGTRRQPHAPV